MHKFDSGCQRARTCFRPSGATCARLRKFTCCCIARCTSSNDGAVHQHPWCSNSQWEDFVVAVWTSRDSQRQSVQQRHTCSQLLQSVQQRNISPRCRQAFRRQLQSARRTSCSAFRQHSAISPKAGRVQVIFLAVIRQLVDLPSSLRSVPSCSTHCSIASCSTGPSRLIDRRITSRHTVVILGWRHTKYLHKVGTGDARKVTNLLEPWAQHCSARGFKKTDQRGQGILCFVYLLVLVFVPLLVLFGVLVRRRIQEELGKSARDCISLASGGGSSPERALPEWSHRCIDEGASQKQPTRSRSKRVTDGCAVLQVEEWGTHNGCAVRELTRLS